MRWAWKRCIYIAVDGLLGGEIEGAPKDALISLPKNSQEGTMKFENKENIVNILDFQLSLIMFNPFRNTSH